MKVKQFILGFLLITASCKTVFAQFSPSQKDLIITKREKIEVTDSIITAINNSYVFPDIALKTAKAIKTYQKKGYYNNIKSSREFADTISDQLIRISNDKHLRVLFSYDTIPQKSEEEAPIPDFIKTFAIQHNYGFNKIEVLEGNIGYLNILGFFPFEEATKKAIAALDFLSSTKALIIDLRENTGGVDTLTRFILSHFINPKDSDHLLEVKFRKGNKVEKPWSSYYDPSQKFVDKPVYVLTSSGTFSAGEAFAYILQASKRATIIGETTGGGANVEDLIRINDHFVLSLPVGAPVNSITKTNWEGVGVKPDMEISKEKALSTAHIIALKKLIENCTTEELKGQLKDILARIQTTL